MSEPNLLGWESEQLDWLGGYDATDILCSFVSEEQQEDFLKNLADLIHTARFREDRGA